MNKSTKSNEQMFHRPCLPKTLTSRRKSLQTFGLTSQLRHTQKVVYPPRKLTWQWKIHLYFLLNTVIFQPAKLVFGTVLSGKKSFLFMASKGPWWNIMKCAEIKTGFEKKNILPFGDTKKALKDPSKDSLFSSIGNGCFFSCDKTYLVWITQ